MLASYLENPTDCYFEGQDLDEKIILLLRAHPVTNLTWIIPSLFIALLPFSFPIILKFLNLLFFNIPQAFISAFLVINYLMVLVIVFEGLLYWYFNVNIITNKRVIDIDFSSVLLKRTNLAPLSSVQEASAKTSGILGLVFDFGDVFVQTAGAKISITMSNVPNPDKVADVVLDEAHKLLKKDS